MLDLGESDEHTSLLYKIMINWAKVTNTPAYYTKL